MKTAFLGMFAGLIVLSLVAWRLIPPPPGGIRTPLVWVVDDNPVRQAQVDLFNKLNPDIYLTIDPSDNEQDKIIVQCSAGIGPDLINCQKPDDLNSLVNAGIPLDVTADLEAKHLDLKSLAWPLALDSCVKDGKVYGFPCNVYGMAIMFNKDNFDRAGLSYPKGNWTWDDVIRTAKQLTIRDANGKTKQFGFAFEWWTMDGLMAGFGGRSFSDDGTRCTLDSPGAIAGYTLGQDLMYKYHVAPTPGDQATLASQGGWGAGPMTYLMSGRAAMAFGARWWLNRTRQQKGLRLGVVETPYPVVRQVGGAGRSALINRFTKHKEAALRFLEFLSQPPYNDLVNKQADGLPAMKSYCFTHQFLHDPAHPDETYNGLWRDIQGITVDAAYSQFIRGGDLDGITAQTDLIQNGLKPAAAALRDAAKDANELIVHNAKTRTWLGDLYRRDTGRSP